MHGGRVEAAYSNLTSPLLHVVHNIYISRCYSLTQVRPCTPQGKLSQLGAPRVHTHGAPETDRQPDMVNKTKLDQLLIRFSVCTGVDSVWGMWSMGARGKFSLIGLGGVAKR